MTQSRKDKVFLLDAVLAGMADLLRRKVPEAGPFPGRHLSMVYPGCPHQGRLYVAPGGEGGCALRASMVAEGTDREVSNYLFSGSRADCLDWLTRPGRAEELADLYDRLALRAEEL